MIPVLLGLLTGMGLSLLARFIEWRIDAWKRGPCRQCMNNLKDYVEVSERLGNALRRIKESLAQFDSPTYDSAAAYGGQVLLMRQTIEAALNPSRSAPAPSSPGTD